MGTCAVCGNEYERSFEVLMQGERFTFDSFECAVHKLAPRCAHCECRVIGHGVEVGETVYCCANCANHSGQTGVRDHAEGRAGNA